VPGDTDEAQAGAPGGGASAESLAAGRRWIGVLLDAPVAVRRGEDALSLVMEQSTAGPSRRRGAPVRGTGVEAGAGLTLGRGPRGVPHQGHPEAGRVPAAAQAKRRSPLLHRRPRPTSFVQRPRPAPTAAGSVAGDGDLRVGLSEAAGLAQRGPGAGTRTPAVLSSTSSGG